MEATDNGTHTESKGTSENRTPNDVIQCSPESKINPNQRQNLKCELCKWETGLIKLSKGKQKRKAHKFKHQNNTHETEVEIETTDINGAHTGSKGTTKGRTPDNVLQDLRSPQFNSGKSKMYS